MPRKYFVFLPQVAGNFEEELKQCLDQTVYERDSGFTPVKFIIFIDQPDFDAFLNIRKAIGESIKKMFKNDCPAFNIIVQPPEKPWKVAVEALYINKGIQNITRKSHNAIRYVVIETESGKELWAAGISGYSYPGNTRKAAEKAFDLMVEILENEKMSLNNIIRQWNYVGDILTVKGECQNYQIFNEVRSEYYKRYRKIKSYPAATGVGVRHGGVILDFFALSPNESVEIQPVHNPGQINAYEYGQQVLKGLSDKGRTIKHPPQFERGLILANNVASTFFVSGTAAISGQETIGNGDIGKQTEVTIENIRKLTDSERIAQIISKPVRYSQKYSLLRVYVKRQNDFKLVKEICGKHFPHIPAIYLEADICRDNLLVEIEGELELY